MGFLIAMIFIFSTTIIVSHYIGKSFARIVPNVFFTIILFLYLFGMFKHLETGVRVLSFLGIVSFFYVIFLAVIKRISVKENPEIKVLVAFSLFFLIIHIGRGCVHGDEYSHWMAVVKGMFYNNKLGNVKDAYTAYKDYPPASALLEYFVLKLGNRFLESDVFRIWGIFQITLLLPFCEALRKNGQRIGYSMIVTFLLPTIFYYSYTETLVDGLLGMLMAYVIYNYYCFKNDWFKYISLALALFVLSITKASGVALAVISLVIIGVDIVIRFDKKDKYSILGCIGGMIAVLFGKFSWQYLLHSENTNSVWRVNRITAASIVEMLKEGKTNLSVPINEVLKDFIKDYVYPNDALNLISVSYLVWIVVAVILGVLIIGCKKFEMKRIVGLVITILLGLIIYSISLLICYLFLWGDSLKDGSFYRYMNTYFSAMLISLFCIYMINKKKSSQRLEILIITVLLLLGRTYEVMKMTVLFPVVNYASVKEEKN